MKTLFLLIFILLLAIPTHAQQKSSFEEFLEQRKTTYIFLATGIATTIIDVEYSKKKARDKQDACERNILFRNINDCKIAAKRNYIASFVALGAMTFISEKYPKYRKYVNAIGLGITTGHTIGFIVSVAIKWDIMYFAWDVTELINQIMAEGKGIRMSYYNQDGIEIKEVRNEKNKRGEEIDPHYEIVISKNKATPVNSSESEENLIIKVFPKK